MDNGTPFPSCIGESDFEKFTWWYAYHATDEEKAAYDQQQREKREKHKKYVDSLKARLAAGEDLPWEEREVIMLHEAREKHKNMTGGEWFMYLGSLKTK